LDVPAAIKRSARYAWTALAFLIISYALLVVIGRQLLPLLDQRQEQVEQLLSERFGMAITTEHLSATWTRFTPRLQARNLRIGAENAEPAIRISSIQSEFDILASVFNAGPVWNELSIGEVKLALREDTDGRWYIGNFPLTSSSDNKGQQLEDLANILRLSTHIGIERLTIDIAFFDGTPSTLYIDNIKIESSADFHRARANLSLDGAEDRAELLIEGRGDNWQHFDGQAYINVKRINLRKALGIVLRGWQPFSALPEAIETNTLLDAELWISALQPGHFNLRGKVKADEIPFNWRADLAPIKNLDTHLSGWFSSGKDWGLQAQNLRFDWGDTIIQPLNISFKQGLGEHWNDITLAADHISLATLKHSLVQSRLAGDALAEVIDTLKPSGTLRGVQLSLDLAKAQPLRQFSSRIEQLSLDSWHHSPAMRGLSGYLHWQGDGGYFDIDTDDDFAMHYPGVYSQFMHYGTTRGRVNIGWTEADASLQIAGGPIAIDSEEGEIRAYLSLDIPTTNKGREPKMVLQAGIKNSHSRYRNNYLPAILDPGLLDWLERSVGDADIAEAGFIWRGSLRGDRHRQRSVQFFAQLANAEIDYAPPWPRLSEASALLKVDDAHFEGVLKTGKLGDGPARAVIDEAVISTLPDALLSVKAAITTPLDTVFDTLLKSPLAAKLSTLEDWEVAGTASARLNMVIPLSSKRLGESYRVTSNIKRAQMQLRTFPAITFSELNGSIAYNDRDGLHATGLNGTLLGQTLTADINSQDGQLNITATGHFDLSKAPIGPPLISANITGTSSYTASFASPAHGVPATLSLLSDLQGIAIDLPQPLLKTAAQVWPLAASLQFRDGDLLIEAHTDTLKAQLRIANRQLANGHIILGDREGTEAQSLATDPVDKAANEGLLISGHTPVFQLDDWLDTLQTDPHSEQSQLSVDFPIRARVAIDHVSAAGFELEAVAVDALYSQQLWNIHLDSPSLAGHLRVPADRDQTIVARLNYLTLPRPEFDSGQSLLNDLDPRTLPALDFATEGLRIGDNELGSLAFVMQANAEGVSIEQIVAEITGITIAKSPGGDGAQLIWSHIDGEHRSQFNGALLSDDLGGVLKAWDMPVILSTDRAVFLSDLSWQGKPWELTANAMDGHIALSFKQGQFFQAPGTTTNALLKVIGLINFDTWLRRLKFDFSDLFAKGVHFDRLEGGLAFEQALVRFDAPIVVTLPSGKMRLLGHTNLVEESIDARLIATLPIGTNLPWIVALAGGLPAAAGVYITSKLFEKQVNRISSISYKITGDLDNPELEVDRIFSDKSD